MQTLATLAADPIASLVDTAYLGRYGAPCRHANDMITTFIDRPNTELRCRRKCINALQDACVADTCLQLAYVADTCML